MATRRDYSIYGNYLTRALGVPGAGMRGGADPLYYFMAGLPLPNRTTQYDPSILQGGNPTPNWNGSANGGGGNPAPPPAPAPAPTPWQTPTLLQTPLPYSLGPDWRQTMIRGVSNPSRNK